MDVNRNTTAMSTPMTADHSKVAVRQSPFDSTLRLFTESYDATQAKVLMEDVKGLLL